jgi:hypothetical protein
MSAATWLAPNGITVKTNGARRPIAYDRVMVKRLKTFLFITTATPAWTAIKAQLNSKTVTPYEYMKA